LIRQQFPATVPIYNLLNTEHYLRLSAAPQTLANMIEVHGQPEVVIVDEVQRVPQLLNEVHRLIEEKQIRFLLTGGSA